jgi:hypothetical protein
MADFLSSILGGPLAAPSTGGGLFDTTNPSTDFALSLLANSGPTRLSTTFGQAVGQSAIQAQDMASQAAMRRTQLAQAYLGLQGAQARQNIINRIANGGGAQPAPPDMSAAPVAANPPINQPPPLIAAPGYQPSQTSQPAAPQPTPRVLATNSDSPLLKWLTPPTQSAIAQSPIGPAAPNDALALAVASGKDLATAQAAIRAQQLAQMRQQYAGQIQTLNSVTQSDSPTRDVRANPTLARLWSQYASARGLDPSMQGSDFTDANLRQVFGGAANQFRAALSEPTSAPPVQQQTIQGPLNSLYMRDPVTGAYTQVRGEEPLHQVDLGNGQHPYLPASQAAGQQSFNATLFGASSMTDDAKRLAYETWKNTGKLPVSVSRSPAASAQLLDSFAQMAKADGDTGSSIAASQASYKSSSQALAQNAKVLTASNGYYGTLEKNLDNLTAAYQKAGSLGSPLLNRAWRAWQQHGSGDPDTATMVTYLNAAQGEYAKLKSGSLGNAPASDAAMADAKEVINKAMTTGGIAAVRQAMLTEGGNRLSSIQAESDRLTGLMSGNAPPTVGVSAPVLTATGPGGKKLYLRNGQWMDR